VESAATPWTQAMLLHIRRFASRDGERSLRGRYMDKRLIHDCVTNHQIRCPTHQREGQRPAVSYTHGVEPELSSF
jgi:hypothetical protein